MALTVHTSGLLVSPQMHQLCCTQKATEALESLREKLKSCIFSALRTPIAVLSACVDCIFQKVTNFSDAKRCLDAG